MASTKLDDKEALVNARLDALEVQFAANQNALLGRFRTSMTLGEPKRFHLRHPPGGRFGYGDYGLSQSWWHRRSDDCANYSGGLRGGGNRGRRCL